MSKRSALSVGAAVAIATLAGCGTVRMLSQVTDAERLDFVRTCVALYVAPRRLGEDCMAAAGAADDGGMDPYVCRRQSIEEWQSRPGGLGSYPDTKSCDCVLQTAQEKLSPAQFVTLVRKVNTAPDGFGPGEANEAEPLAIWSIADSCLVFPFEMSE